MENGISGDSIAIKIQAIGNHYVSQHGNVGLIIGIYRQRTNPNIPVPPEIYSFGHVRRDTNSPAPDSLTFFKLGSVEKTFCATILAKNLMDTVLDVKLNDKINKYLPDTLRIPRFIDTTVSPHDTTFITLLDLATHYSSLPDDPSNLVEPPGYTLQKLYEFFESYYDSLSHKPGTRYLYSNLGFGTLGDIGAMVLDTTYEEAAKRIFQELGMTNTKIMLSPSDTPKVAQGHNANGMLVQHYLRVPSPALEGAGAHFSTMKDMLRFLAFNLGFLQTPLNNTRDSLYKWRKNLNNNPENGQGLAWQIVRLYNDPVTYHMTKDGDSPDGYSSFITFRQETKTGVVVMSNSTNAPDSVANVVMKILNPIPTGISESINEIPESIKLHQNFPNPFNPSTEIKFEISVGGYASLKIYDNTGKLATVLLSEYLPAGHHVKSFEASSLPSGLYYYTLELNGVKISRKMALVK